MQPLLYPTWIWSSEVAENLSSLQQLIEYVIFLVSARDYLSVNKNNEPRESVLDKRAGDFLRDKSVALSSNSPLTWAGQAEASLHRHTADIKRGPPKNLILRP